ncbi:MAG TPA: endolytic transglycosylase MltG, partial [Rhizomicrobium sp.]|nr:endolytic transglycosylase MltG [Rhizomicrobium sp.]
YNSYVIAGLPPGPICNPGKDSVAAVLNPQASKDLYFVATGRGGHVFASNSAQQARNVAAYRAFERQNRAGRRVEESSGPGNTTVTVLDPSPPKLPPLARRKSTRHR